MQSLGPPFWAAVVAAVAGLVLALFSWFRSRADRRVEMADRREEAAPLAHVDWTKAVLAEAAEMRRETREEVGRLRMRIDVVQAQLDAALDNNRELRIALATVTIDLGTAQAQVTRLSRELGETRNELVQSRRRERVLADEMTTIRTDVGLLRSLRPPPTK